VQPDVFAVVNCPIVALSVFYSTVLMRSHIFAVTNCADVALIVSGYFLPYELLCLSLECRASERNFTSGYEDCYLAV